MYFACDLYKKLNKRIQSNINIEDFKTFNQGHDILMFAINLYNHNKKEIGNYVHKHNTQDFFKNMITYIYNNNLQNNYNVMAYLYGYIGHYSLDCTMHPYVTYKCGIFDKKNKQTYKYNSKHSDLESYIDAYFINKNENISPNKYKMYKFCFNATISDELSKLIDDVFYKTYNLKKISTYIKQGIVNMKISYRILRYDPFKIKKSTYKIIDKILPKSVKRLSPISYSYKLDKNNYYLNLDKKIWNHPRYKEEIYDFSVIELYNNALDMALNIINEVNTILYKDGKLSKLDKIFTNLSFTSGKNCNDKTKNRYFEF